MDAKGLKIVAEATDGDDRQQVVIERSILNGEGGQDENGMDVGKAANALLDEIMQELGKAGLAIAQSDEDAVQIKLTLALLRGDAEIKLRATFKPAQPAPNSTTEPPAQEG